jgi:hypothetical protein
MFSCPLKTNQNGFLNQLQYQICMSVCCYTKEYMAAKKKPMCKKNKCNRNAAQPVVCVQVENMDQRPVPVFCECGIKHQCQMELNDSVKTSLVDLLLQKSLWEMFPSTTTELSFLQCCFPTSCKLTHHM